MLQCPRCGRQYPDDVHICLADLTPLQADPTLADVALDPLIGKTFEGKYRLDERLGGGGMGTVYRATHLLIDRPVALKVLSQRFVGDETAQQRFRREARAAGRVQHPNAVTVTDFGATEDGYLYIVMELLEGRTLRDLLAREAPLDSARAVSFMLQVCAAVGAAHEAGLIHRDLKPANIFIEQRADVPAVVKVLDFGVSKFVVEEHDDDYQTLTQVGAIIGTPRYMSPEQCSGAAPLTPASDVYSLGIILYELLTGSAPFSGETPLAMALKHVTEPPRPPRELVPAIPSELEAIVLHALAKNPAARPADANELRSELHAIAESLGFEHSGSNLSPSIEELRSAGTESPSGRLVIDLATLRQVQAASTSGSDPTTSQDSQPAPRRIARLNVPIQSAKANHSVRWLTGVVVGAILLISVLGSGVLVSQWWHKRAVPNATPELKSPTAKETSSPSPGTSAEPSPSASPSGSPSGKENHRPNRDPKKEDKKESNFGKFVHKLRKIF